MSPTAEGMDREAVFKRDQHQRASLGRGGSALTANVGRWHLLSIDRPGWTECGRKLTGPKEPWDGELPGKRCKVCVARDRKGEDGT